MTLQSSANILCTGPLHGVELSPGMMIMMMMMRPYLWLVDGLAGMYIEITLNLEPSSDNILSRHNYPLSTNDYYHSTLQSCIICIMGEI